MRLASALASPSAATSCWLDTAARRRIAMTAYDSQPGADRSDASRFAQSLRRSLEDRPQRYPRNALPLEEHVEPIQAGLLWLEGHVHDELGAAIPLAFEV